MRPVGSNQAKLTEPISSFVRQRALGYPSHHPAWTKSKMYHICSCLSQTGYSVSRCTANSLFGCVIAYTELPQAAPNPQPFLTPEAPDLNAVGSAKHFQNKATKQHCNNPELEVPQECPLCLIQHIDLARALLQRLLFPTAATWLKYVGKKRHKQNLRVCRSTSVRALWLTREQTQRCW